MVKHSAVTRHSRIHPYPAMIADPLAVYISDRFVKRNSTVLDPFCGTSRTLIAAAEKGARCVGVDINPLAIGIARAKVAYPPADELRAVLEKTPLKPTSGVVFELHVNRSVRWFSRGAVAELSELIRFANRLKVRGDTLRVVAAILSATVREVSYCRKDQWKLHRLNRMARRRHRVSPLSVFRRRLRSFIDEATKLDRLPGRCRFLLGDSRDLTSVLKARHQPRKYDVIVTSPPYGDSQTTVSYGGMSSICLGVLRHLSQVRFSHVSGGVLDRKCLGGERRQASTKLLRGVRRYWRAPSRRMRDPRVVSYLYDLEVCCSQIKYVSRSGTVLVLVVARRSVYGRRVYTDRFITDQLRQCGFALVETIGRRIRKKNTPVVIDRNGAGEGPKRTATIRREFVLIYRRVR
jgi:site-specific DNA-methyltransferase (cytosine-N4-specific)